MDNGNGIMEGEAQRMEMMCALRLLVSALSQDVHKLP